MCERRLHREREEDDAGDHRQVQVGVDVAREGDALRRRFGRRAAAAARIGKKSKYASQNDVATTNPSTAATITPVPSASSLAPRPIATSDSPIAMITISPWRSTKCAGWTRQPLTPREQRPDEADGERGEPEQRLAAPPCTNPATRISVAPASDHGAIRRIAAEESRVAACRERVQREVHDASRSGTRRRTRRRGGRTRRDRERGDEHRRHRDEHRRPDAARRPGRPCSSARRTTPTPTRAPRGSGARARARSRSGCRERTVVTCVNAKTKTRSKNSSSGVTRCSRSACSLTAGRYPSANDRVNRNPAQSPHPICRFGRALPY